MDLAMLDPVGNSSVAMDPEVSINFDILYLKHPHLLPSIRITYFL
jgi:hypothetical protein